MGVSSVKTSFENDANSLKDYGQERPLTQLPKTTPSHEAQLPNTSKLALGINSNRTVSVEVKRTSASCYPLLNTNRHRSSQLASLIGFPKNVPKDRDHRWN